MASSVRGIFESIFKSTSQVAFAMAGLVGAAAAAPGCAEHYVRAVDAVGFSDRLAALHYYEGLRDECGRDPDYLSHLASLNYLAGSRAAGEKIVDDGLIADPTSKDLLFSKGYIYLFHSDLDNADRIGRQLMTANKDWFGGYSIHQKVLMDQGRFADSLEYSRKALALSRNTPMLYLNDAVANFYAGNLVACVESVRAAVDKDPALFSQAWGIDEAIFALDKLDRRAEAFELAKKRRAADPHWHDDANLVRVLMFMEKSGSGSR